MSVIKISEIQPSGLELFQDSESFLNELTVQEMQILGGDQYIGQFTETVGFSIVKSEVKTFFSYAGRRK
jgi:hypothetical protein